MHFLINKVNDSIASRPETLTRIAVDEIEAILKELFYMIYTSQDFPL